MRRARQDWRSCPAPPIRSTQVQEALDRAADTGCPLMVKAVFGSGGRGIRLAGDAAAVREVPEQARSEAQGTFGRAAVYLEAAIRPARHIEVQVLGDGQGGLVHLYERDCSVQRRHQKVVEVAPAVGLSEARRQAVCEAAAHLLASVGYRGAGTVEFLLAPDGAFYFLKVNPRIQVEHTVTELVTGVDIVQAQIRIAEGHRLADPEIGIGGQQAVRHQGFAIQCRVTAEDPKNAFLPNTGRILTYRFPGGYGIRLDGAEPGRWSPPTMTRYWSNAGPGPRPSRGPWPTCAAPSASSASAGCGPPCPSCSRPSGIPSSAPGVRTPISSTARPHCWPTSSRATAATSCCASSGRSRSTGCRGRGWAARLRPLLLSDGPEAVTALLRREPRLHLTDTTFRDAHQSLLAARVRTHDLLAAAAEAAYFDGIFSVECWCGAPFDTALRFLHESPWDRLEALRSALPNTLLQMLLRGSNAVGYANYPDNVVEAFVAEAAEAGIDVFRIFDSLNWIEGLKVAVTAALRSGRLVEGALCYSGDCADPGEDLYTVQCYTGLAALLKALGVRRIGIKDMAGLLRPASASRLVAALRAEVGLPVHRQRRLRRGLGAGGGRSGRRGGRCRGGLDGRGHLAAQPDCGRGGAAGRSAGHGARSPSLRRGRRGLGGTPGAVCGVRGPCGGRGPPASTKRRCPEASTPTSGRRPPRWAWRTAGPTSSRPTARWTGSWAAS